MNNEDKQSDFTDNIHKLVESAGSTFSDVSNALSEFAKQGLCSSDSLKATESAIKISQLSGTSLKNSVDGMIAVVDAFKK